MPSIDLFFTVGDRTVSC